MQVWLYLIWLYKKKKKQSHCNVVLSWDSFYLKSISLKESALSNPLLSPTKVIPITSEDRHR